eukprot:530390_1
MSTFGIIPDSWRLNYPHFIGPPKLLHNCFLLVVAICVVAFGTSIFYYYQIDTEQIIEISGVAKNDPMWNCESINMFTGEYSFMKKSVNFTMNENPTFFSAVPDRRCTIKTSAATVSMTTWYPDENYAYTKKITMGYAPTIDKCIETMNKYICAATSVPTYEREKIYLYKWTRTTMKYPDLRYNSSSPEVLSWPYKNWIIYKNSNFSSIFMMFDLDNLCDIIDNAIDNGEMNWYITSPYICNDGYCYNQSKVDVKCEQIDNNYCVINATNQFTFTGNNVIPPNTRIENINGETDSEISMLVGSEWGNSCEQRWETFCMDFYDIEGYCALIFAPPYSCVKTQHKSIYTILSLSFASANLVFTILLLIVACLCNTFARPVHGDNTMENAAYQLMNDDNDMHKL